MLHNSSWYTFSGPRGTFRSRSIIARMIDRPLLHSLHTSLCQINTFVNATTHIKLPSSKTISYRHFFLGNSISSFKIYYFNIFETRSSWSVGAPVKSAEETSDIDIDGTRFPVLVLVWCAQPYSV